MATLNEGVYRGEAIVQSEEHSFEGVTVLSGQNLTANTVIGRVSRGVGRVSTPTVVGTGNGTVSQIFAGPEVEVGNYVLTCTAVVANGGVWSLTSPSGLVLETLTMTPGAGGTTVYTSRHVNFSITDGATDFAVGDVFTFVVSTTAPLVIGTGNGTVSGLSLGPDARPGNYRVEITAAILNGGEFKVLGPNGAVVEQGFIVAGAGGTFVGANKRQLNLTITEGSTDFAVGDAFNIAVFNELALHGSVEGGKVVAFDPTPASFDGRHVAAGVLLGAVDATSGDVVGTAVVRRGVVHAGELVWIAGLTTQGKDSGTRDLAARDIVVAVTA